MKLVEWDKGINGKIVVELSDYNKQTYLNIRVYFQKDNEWFPTKKGINLNVDYLAELKKAIERAE